MIFRGKCLVKVALFSPCGYVGKYVFQKLKSDSENIVTGISRETDLDAIKEKFDVLVYTASVTSARQENTLKYITDNSVSAVHMVEFAKKCNIKRIIYLSTDEIYGQINADEVNEQSEMVSPNIYATTKYLAERIIIESGIPYFILRSPGIVGNERGHNFINEIMEKIKWEEDIHVYNAEKEFNNIVEIEDLAQFFLKLIKHGSIPRSEVFVLGNCEKIELLKIIDFIKKMYNSSSKVYNDENSKKRYFTLNIEKAVSYGYSSKKIWDILCDLKRVQNDE